MLREHEHPDRRVSLFDRACRFEAFGGVGWRHADVDHHEVWRSRGFRWMVEVVEQLVRVCEGGNNVVTFIAVRIMASSDLGGGDCVLSLARPFLGTTKSRTVEL